MALSKETRDVVLLLRGHVKTNLDLSQYGCCNKVIEASIVTAAKSILWPLTPEETEELKAGTVPSSIGAEECAEAYARPKPKPTEPKSASTPT